MDILPSGGKRPLVWLLRIWDGSNDEAVAEEVFETKAAARFGLFRWAELSWHFKFDPDYETAGLTREEVINTYFQPRTDVYPTVRTGYPFTKEYLEGNERARYELKPFRLLKRRDIEKEV